MCVKLKGLLNRVLIQTKQWSIRKQMMVCYVLAMVTILLLILFLVLFNLYLLRDETITKVEDTLDEQAKDNMQALVREGGAYLYSHVFEIVVLFDMLKEMLVDMQVRDHTFALDVKNFYSYEQLPGVCEMKKDERYGEKPVCFQYSSWVPQTSNVDQVLLQKVARFDNFWETLLNLTDHIVFRYLIYIEDQFVQVFPGQYVQPEYNPKESVWYNEFKEADAEIISSLGYQDRLGANSQIISIVAQMVNGSGIQIGIILADVQVEALYQGISDLTYLDTGEAMIVCKNGDVLRTENNDWWGMENISDLKIWKDVKNTPTGMHTMDWNDTDYRVASTPICTSLSDCGDNWWYVVMLIVEEHEIMKYKRESEDKIEDAGLLLVLITICSSTVTVIVIVVLIHFLAKSITEPLQGIIDFTNKINANATERDMVTQEELEQLKTGEDQVAQLVQAFKDLASSLINRREDRMPRALQATQSRVYPPNELYRSNRIPWKQLLDSIKD